MGRAESIVELAEDGLLYPATGPTGASSRARPSDNVLTHLSCGGSIHVDQAQHI